MIAGPQHVQPAHARRIRPGMPLSNEPSDRPSLIAYICFLAVTAVAGGSSRFDAASQPLIRLAAIVLIGFLIWQPRRRAARDCRPALLFLGAAVLAVIVQLIPLPPGLWAILPGHAPYLEAARAAGEAQPWRPINLVPERGWNALFALLPPGAALLAATRLASRSQARVLAAWIVIALASALIGLAQISSADDSALRFYASPTPGTALGIFANRNHEALFLCCGVAMFAAWWSTSTAVSTTALRIRGLLATTGIIFLFLMIFCTGSRAGLGLGIVALLCSIPLAWSGARRTAAAMNPRQIRFMVTIAGLVLLSLVGMALAFGRAEGVARLMVINPADDVRFTLLRPLRHMIATFFPIGAGFGSFDLVYRGFEPFENLAPTLMNEAHNEYMQLMLEGGALGLLLILFVLYWWFTAAFRLARNRNRDSATMLGWLGIAMLLFVLLASLVDYPARTPLVMVLAAQSAAWALCARTGKGTDASSRPNFTPRVAAPMTTRQRGFRQ